MILIDTSIWIDHIRVPNLSLEALFAHEQVVQHPLVTAEVALGSIASRAAFIEQLRMLPAAPMVSDEELLSYIESAELPAKGIGLVDAHLLASAAVLGNCRLWTRDKRLHAQAERLDLAYSP